MRVVHYAYVSHGRTPAALGRSEVTCASEVSGAKGAHVRVRMRGPWCVRPPSCGDGGGALTVAIDESASSAHEFAVATTSCDAFVIFR